MFTADGVTVRPLDLADRAPMYRWYLDGTADRFSGWSKRISRDAFDLKWERLILDPPSGIILFAIDVADACVGRIELARIDRDNRHAAVGLLVGETSQWGKGIGAAALRLVADVAFSIENLERLYAHVFGFNTRSRRLMLRVGFQAEGVLRRHELHNGLRQDMHVFGLLREEFYATNGTLFPLPAAGAS